MILYILFYLLFAVNCYLTIARKKSSAIVVLSLLLFGFMFTFNAGLEGDHETYKDLFFYPDLEISKDLMFFYFIKLVRLLGVSNYNLFLFIEYIIGLGLITLGVKSVTTNYHPMIAVAMLYIFPHCAVAIRFYLAFSIIIFSLRYFINRRLARNKIFYILCIIIASLFHACVSVFLLTIPLVFTKENFYQNKSWRITSSLFLIFSGILIIIFYTYKDSYALTLIVNLLEEDAGGRGAGYFQSIDYSHGALIGLPIYFIGLILSHRFFLFGTHNNDKNDEKIARMCKVISSVHCLYIIWIITLVFMFLDMTFIRVLFIPSVVVLLAYGRILDSGGYSKHFIRVNSLLFILILLSWEVVNNVGLYSISSNMWIKEALRFF